MEKQYAIIQFHKDGAIYPTMNDVGSLWVFDTLKEADDRAFALEAEGIEDCRVISIDSVHE